jgi:hypothetical protein
VSQETETQQAVASQAEAIVAPTSEVMPTYEISKRRYLDSLGALEKRRPRTELEKWSGTLEEWQAHGESLSKAVSGHQWEIAEWVARGDRAFKTKAYDMAEALTGYSRSTLQQWVSVYRGCFIRIKELSFGHHQLVAAFPSHVQKQALEFAVRHNLSVAGFRRQIKKELKAAKAKNTPADWRDTPPDEVRKLTVSFTRDEYLTIKQWADACGISESQLVQQIVFDWYRLGGIHLPRHLRKDMEDYC